MVLPDPPKTEDHRLPPRIGELLVKQGLLKKEELAEALSIQKRERELRELPLGQILVELGFLTEPHRKEILNHPELRKNIGALAVEKGLIEQSQLDTCLSIKEPAQPIGEMLIEKGLLTSEQVGDLLQEQAGSSMFGELAVRLGVIRKKDLEIACQMQNAPRKLGEILCQQGFINPLDLNHVLKKFNKQLEIGEMLLSLGYLNKEQLQWVYQEQAQSGESLERILTRKRMISVQQLQNAISRQYNTPFESLADFTYSEEAKRALGRIISQKYAEKNMVLPISLERNRFKLALFDPQNMVQVMYELKSMYPQFIISCILITQEKFEELFEVLYSRHLGGDSDNRGSDGGDVEMDIMDLNLEEKIGAKSEKTTLYGVSDVEAEELMNYILKYGIIHGASDIHIEQDREAVRLRYRIDGMLREISVGWLKEKLQGKVSAVISRIKVVSNLDIAEKRLPQDGVFRLNYYDREKGERVDLDFRVATCRASVGENVTIRILDPRKANVGLESLNHSPHILNQFKTFLMSPSGMILVCGPTGSGKSSTLYAALQYIYSPRTKIITAEDPIEYSFPGIMQTQVNPKIGLTFSKLLRSFLRLDPDVILIGEMRDEETAKIGFDAAQTGHLILSTLHTNDAISAVPRLLDLKVEYGQIASSLMCVIAQRLVRKICSSCIGEHIPGADEWSVLFNKYPAHLKFFNGKGCEACNLTGYSGRTLISEIFAVDPEISHALNRGYDESEITRLALESGMSTMLEDGLSKTHQTTLQEIIRMIPHDMIKAFRARHKSQSLADELLDTLQNTGGRPDKADVSPGIFLLKNPETERGVIDLMKSKYEALCARGDGSTKPVDPILFREFVTTSFYQLCQKFKCRSLNFHIQQNQTATGADISALPNNEEKFIV